MSLPLCQCPDCGYLMSELEIESFRFPQVCPFCRKCPCAEFLRVPAIDQGVRMFDDNTTEAHERRITRCREPACNARIIFLTTDTGSKMPVDADTVEPEDEEFDPDRHGSHFATCAAAAKFRKRTP
jgi:hypothetical protein